jgi:ankyrin repeat protein
VVVGNIKKVTKLLDKGADIHNNNDEVLMCAIANGLYDMTKLLIDKGANIYAVNLTDRTAISCACRYKHLNIVELLFQEGAQLNNYDNYRLSEMIRVCIENDDVECLQILIEHGLKIDEFNSLNESFDLRTKKKNILEFILDNYPDVIKNHDIEIDISDKDINKYHFIKMLVERQFIDLPD